MKYTTDIYVRESSWHVYIVGEDEYGSTIAVSANKDTMDAVIYDLGWEAYRDSAIERDCTVTVYPRGATA